MPRIPLSVRIRALFVRDSHAFWWNHFTDEERELRGMNARQLAAALHEAREQRDNERQILVEHMLALRLARVQSRASWGSGTLGFAGAVLGAALTVGLTAAITPNAPEPQITVKCESSKPLHLW